MTRKMITLILSMMLAAVGCIPSLAYAETSCSHEWGSWGNSTATCTNEGEESRYCVNCGEYEYRKVAAKGHNWSEWLSYSGTCLEGTERRYCRECYKEEFRGEGEHDWSEWGGNTATCTTGGKEYRRCYYCDKEESRDTAAIGHDWSGWYSEIEATCSKKGRDYRYCSTCNIKETRTVEATGKHDWWEIDEPKYKKLDEKYHLAAYENCLECGTEKWKKEKHNWGEWKTVKAATIKKDGYKSHTCMDCGKTVKVKAAKLKPFAKFDKKTYSLKAGQSMTLKVKYAKGDKIKSWKSSNTRIAKVNKKGKVTAKKKGKVQITVTMKSGKKATCTVKVAKQEKKKASAAASAVGGTVYWTPAGKVYHVSRNCKTLSKSKTVYSGTISESGKPRVCKVCGH